MTLPAESFSLAGNVAFITGAAGGLGQCFARTLHAAGAHVVLGSRRIDRPELLQLSDELDVRCDCLAVDVTSEDSVAEAFAALDAKQLVVDVLVNNAGVAVSGEAHRLDSAAWNTVVNTNLRGAWTMAQHFTTRLIEQQHAGSIINIASILGLQPGKGTAPYAISKSGLIQMTRALALEWARYNIRVNALSPGYVETDINRDFLQTDAAKAQLKKIPTRRIGQADDLSGPLLLLASYAGRHMTGANIVVDGGHSCLSL